MTPAQKMAIARLKVRLIEREKRTGGGHIKEWEVKESNDTKLVFLYVVLGRENDEGTMAAIFCRLWVHYAIGVRGGVDVLSVHNGTHNPLKKHYWQYK